MARQIESFDLVNERKGLESFDFEDEKFDCDKGFQTRCESLDIKYDSVVDSSQNKNTYKSQLCFNDFKIHLVINLEKIRFSSSASEYFIWKGVELWITDVGRFDDEFAERDFDDIQNIFFDSVYKGYKTWNKYLKALDSSFFSTINDRSVHTKDTECFKRLIHENFRYDKEEYCDVGNFDFEKICKIVKSEKLNAFELAAWVSIEAVISHMNDLNGCWVSSDKSMFNHMVDAMAEAVVMVLDQNQEFYEIYKTIVEEAQEPPVKKARM